MSRTDSNRRFIADRMLGTLTRYLRFMGYDTLSANSLRRGNNREDTLILEIAAHDGRVILTRDRELARRGGQDAVLITSEAVLDQVRQLVTEGIIENTHLRMTRCSLCNNLLRPATMAEVKSTDYAPEQRNDLDFFWCSTCHRLYWMGSHGRNLAERLSGKNEGPTGN